MKPETATSNDLAAMARFLEEHHNAPDFLTIEDKDTGCKRYITVIPDRMTARDITDDLKKLLPAPERRVGTLKVTSLDGFLLMVNRWKAACTVVYADDGQQPTLTAVINDHHPDHDGTPGFRDHRIVYQPTLSDEWQTWLRGNNKLIPSEAFAEMLEDRALDVIDPNRPLGESTARIVDALNVKLASPSELAGLARNLTVRVDMKVKEHRNLQSGEGQILFEASHTNEDGTPLIVPGAFLLGFPIYKGGPGYLFVARLRYKVKEGQIFWTYLLSQTDLAKRETMAEMIRKVGAETAVQVVEGQPG